MTLTSTSALLCLDAQAAMYLSLSCPYLAGASLLPSPFILPCLDPQVALKAAAKLLPLTVPS